jgi:2-dehydropantoate 2-reductase
VNGDKILIIGTGALATLFSARLSGGGVQVSISGTWKAALDAFQQNGAQIEGEPAHHVDVTSDSRQYIPVKQCMILVKSQQTDRAAHDLLPCVENDGVTLTLQNGLGNKEKLISVLGKDRVVPGVTTIGARLIAPGVVRISGKGIIWVERHSRVDVLVNMLRFSGFKVHLVDDIQPYAWRKLIVNCAINPLSALLQVKNGDLLEDPVAWEVVEQLVEEAVCVARAINIDLGIEDPQLMVKKVAQETKENLSSMLQDILRGVPTEIDAINGAIICLAEIHTVDVRVNKLVYSLPTNCPI